ncbi:MAG: hypothetical protein ABIZ07_07125 [Dermatophilaceae bacterium]
MVGVTTAVVVGGRKITRIVVLYAAIEILSFVAHAARVRRVDRS